MTTLYVMRYILISLLLVPSLSFASIPETKDKYLAKHIEYFAKYIHIEKGDDYIILTKLPHGWPPWEGNGGPFTESDNKLVVGDSFYWTQDNFDRQVYKVKKITPTHVLLDYTQSTRGSIKHDYIDKGSFKVKYAKK